ncbi:hypothetical protein DXG01_011094 [Tephrocybe rancida]|nr:hypothetical protein DXG01_011094 [Tephrocybe rancida]
MSFACVLSSTVRSSPSRLAGRRFVPRVACVGEARTFSLLVQNSARSRSHRSPLLSLTSRNITQDAAKTQAVSSAPVDVVTPAVGVPLEPVMTDAAQDLLPDMTSTLATHLPAALQYGDLAALGLAAWTPAGVVRWSLEIINVATGLPWFWTIVAGSLLWKVALIPISVKSLQNSARLLPIQGKIKKLQDEMVKVRQSGDKLALQRLSLKFRKTYSDANVSMGATALVPFVQIPVTLGLFFGIKKMCELPVLQLAHSGFSILPDLTVADPYMVLPVLLCAAVNLQIQIGAAEMDLTTRPQMGHVMNGLRVLSIMGIYIMGSFPSGLMVSLLTTSAATTLQSWALQQPSIRAKLNIPQVPLEARGKLPSPLETVQYLIAKYRTMAEEAKTQQRQGRR